MHAIPSLWLSLAPCLPVLGGLPLPVPSPTASLAAPQLNEFVVEDAEPVLCRLRNESGALVLDVEVDGAWIPTSGAIRDELSASSEIETVVAKFEAQQGYELRVSIDGRPGTWTTGRVQHRIEVPATGETRSTFVAETRPLAGGAYSGLGGYVKVKKLDS